MAGTQIPCRLVSHLGTGTDQVDVSRGSIEMPCKAVARVLSTSRRSWPACGAGNSGTRHPLPAPAVGRDGRANPGSGTAADGAQACETHCLSRQMAVRASTSVCMPRGTTQQPVARATCPRCCGAGIALCEHRAYQAAVLLLHRDNCGIVACMLRYCGSGINAATMGWAMRSRASRPRRRSRTAPAIRPRWQCDVALPDRAPYAAFHAS